MTDPRRRRPPVPIPAEGPGTPPFRWPLRRPGRRPDPDASYRRR